MNTRTEQVLAQLAAAPMLTDGGLETDLVFNHAVDLPNFASFDLLSTDWGREKLKTYYRSYLELARTHGCGFVLETPTWRASRDWGEKMGYDVQALAAVNADAVAMMQALREEFADVAPVLVSGNIGPRGDGYVVADKMSAEQARDYHAEQIDALAAAGADMVSVLTLNYLEEGLGIAMAARERGIPVVVSFTVETDGRLPSGESLGDAIAEVDAQTDGYPAYYMINCAHPSHFHDMLAAAEGDWTARIRGLRGNASRCSHEELDAAEVLDDGDPQAFGREYRELHAVLPNLRVLGGCCGTDLRHVTEIAAACL
ncbi:homocysteine S-methyltransferase [Mangrovimicrobium sediminis]|uniref:Homocysteine S-methyltransferase n=1 Tax=Mangrovimicrobium sediminis TaxID=2562682 RepID=A0A4Z0LXH4_9GAMM|nr:homocysteine S-methyltransferase family protein [Haliea sp. SAOS-164]TGD71785.1 homocysteine S-methyltransferase [Haliea sp. SAOS-164]